MRPTEFFGDLVELMEKQVLDLDQMAIGYSILRG